VSTFASSVHNLIAVYECVKGVSREVALALPRGAC
jgi:hypothetical protein